MIASTPFRGFPGCLPSMATKQVKKCKCRGVDWFLSPLRKFYESLMRFLQSYQQGHVLMMHQPMINEDLSQSWWCNRPALLTRISTLPWIAIASLASSWRVSSGDVTSNSRMSAPFSFKSSSFAIDRARPVAMTFSPRFKTSQASSRPRPDLCMLRTPERRYY